MKKTVLITGTSSGIGKALAKEFAKNGWHVIATMRHPEKEKELKEIKNILVTPLDVEKTDSIQKAIGKGIKEYGGIDVLVNNAGIGLFGVFEATPEENIRKLFETNLFGTMAVTKAILPHFRKRKAGMIVNLSSSTGLFTFPLMSVYCASKYALEGFSESLSFELSSQDIKIKLIEPGMVESNFDDTTRNNYAADPDIDAYQDYMTKMIQLFSIRDPGEGKVTAENAARKIYNAVTDDTDTLRYTIGEEVKSMIATRHKMNDEDYMAMMRKKFSI